jgi:hypothetical protein
MWYALAFVALGFLVGQLVSLSAASLAKSLLGLLFAFGGGSAIGLLKKLEGGDRILACKGIFFLSMGCLAGIYGGIYVSEHQMLTPNRTVAEARMKSGEVKYLRKDVTAAALAVDQLRANHDLTDAQAVGQLVEIVERVRQKSDDVRSREQRGVISDKEAYDELFAFLSGEEK